MRRRGLAGSFFALALLAPVATRAQSLGEVGAAMGVHDAAAGTAAPNASALRDRLKSAGNPSGSTNPYKILADYGNRVASEGAKQTTGKGGWAAGTSGGTHGGGGKGWAAAGSGGHAAATGSAWAKNDKGPKAAPAARRR